METKKVKIRGFTRGIMTEFEVIEIEVETNSTLNDMKRIAQDQAKLDHLSYFEVLV